MSLTADDRVIGVGVIGLGFMGATHVRAYQRAALAGYPCRLAAVCDGKAERRAGVFAGLVGNGVAGSGIGLQRAFDPSSVNGYADAAQLLSDPAVDLVSICTPTDSHVALAEAAMRAGKHVLVEKPVALRSDLVRHLADVSRQSGMVCMPAMCMRFWPGWDTLAKMIRAGSMGRCLSVRFERISPAPGWSPEFYRDDSRSGGVLFDLHVHDVDFICWIFGTPASVRAEPAVAGDDAVGGTRARAGESIRGVTSVYQFGAGGPGVVAKGVWTDPETPFRMRYQALFEGGSVEFDSKQSPALTLSHNGEIRQPLLPAIDGYDGEVRDMINALRRKRKPSATLDEAAAVTAVLEAERLSLDTGLSARPNVEGGPPLAVEETPT